MNYSVALSRQKSYLLIVGDIKVTGPVVARAPAVGAQAGARAGRGGRGGRGGGRGGRGGGVHVPQATDYFQVVRDNGVVHMRAVALRGALLAIQNAGRVVTFTI